MGAVGVFHPPAVLLSQFTVARGDVDVSFRCRCIARRCSKVATGKINNKGVVIRLVMHKLVGGINNIGASKPIVTAKYVIDVRVTTGVSHYGVSSSLGEFKGLVVEFIPFCPLRTVAMLPLVFFPTGVEIT